MDAAMKTTLENQIRQVISALEKNNMKGYYAPTREDALSIARSLLNPGDTVAFGGSVTLKECGVLEMLRGGDYRLLDRGAPGLTPEQVREVFLQSFGADAYFCSSNAVTMDGRLYNVDGNSNRVAAICFGPKSVIMIVGCQKLVTDLDAAAQRVRSVTAPANCVRLDCTTPCREAGSCCRLEDGEVGQGCNSDRRICCNFVVSGKQRVKDRIKVIIVGEPLGY